MTEPGARPDQPPLPLAFVPRLGEADFFVSDANRVAVAWLAAPPNWPMPRTLLIGPAQSGKSHLARLFGARHGGQVIDDADRSPDPEALFHAWNAATPAAPLLLTARQRPADWGHGLPDLASRLAATPLARLEEPDDALLGAVLAKHFADRGVRVGEDVVAWLVARIERSFAAAARVAAELDAAALAGQRAITIPLARERLETQWPLAL